MVIMCMGAVICQLLVHKEEMCWAWIRLFISTQPLTTTIFWTVINIYFSFIHIGFVYTPPCLTMTSQCLSLFELCPIPSQGIKRKHGMWFYDDCGFPDASDTYDHLLHNIDGGVVLHKKCFDTPALNQDNPVLIRSSWRPHMATSSRPNSIYLTSPQGRCKAHRSDQAILVCVWWSQHVRPGLSLPMCHQHWKCSYNCHEENSLWPSRKNDHEEEHSGFQEDGPNPPNNQWSMVVQSFARPKAPSKICPEHRGFCLLILCKLHSAQPGHVADCLPKSPLW